MTRSIGTVRPGAWTRGFRRRALVVGLALIALVLGAGCRPMWGQRGYGEGHGAFNPVESTLTSASVGGLGVAYDVSLPVSPAGEPVVVEGLAVVTGLDVTTEPATAVVSAAVAETAAPRWTTQLPSPVVEVSSLATDGTRVFVLTSAPDGAVVAHALARATGAVEWSTTVLAAPSVEGWTTLNPVLTLVSGRLIVSSGTADGPAGALVFEQVAAGIDPVTGAVTWTRRHGVVEPRGSSVVGVGDGSVIWAYADSGPGGVDSDVVVTRSLLAADGSEQWIRSSAAGEVAIAAAAADEGRVVGHLGEAAFPEGAGGVVDAASGAPVWHGAPSLSPPAVVTDTRAIWTLVDLGIANGLRSFALADGAEQWTIAFPSGSALRSAAAAGSVIYVVTDDGSTLSLRTYDLGSGNPIGVTALAVEGDAEISVAGPVVAAGQVLVALDDRLVALTA